MGEMNNIVLIVQKENGDLCPCCGFRTFDDSSRGNYEICPVCYWEDDLTQEVDPNYEGGANGISLSQAKKNYREIGAIKNELVKFTREPLDNEIP